MVLWDVQATGGMAILSAVTYDSTRKRRKTLRSNVPEMTGGGLASYCVKDFCNLATGGGGGINSFNAGPTRVLS